MLALAAPAAAAAHDRVEVAVAHEREQHAAAIAAAEQRISSLAGEARTRAIRALRKLREGKLAAAPDELAEIAPALALLGEARRATAAARAAYADAFTADERRTVDAIVAIATDPRFQEAVLWQNSQAFRRAVASVGSAPTINYRERERQQLVASYWQRYCTKNETIGFFGPQGIATIEPGVPDLELAPGAGLVAKRTVNFEHWSVAALAARLAADRELAFALAPRRRPTIRITDSTLHHPVDQHTEIDPEIAAVLAACDGVRSARELADELGSEEVYPILAELNDRQLITWTLEVPTGVARPEDQLRATLERTGGHAAQGALAAVDELVAARDRVAAAAGDPGRLDRALREIEATFQRLSGHDPARKGGQVYAGRTVVYEECARNLRCALGPALLGRIAQPLALVLDSARWVTERVGARCRTVAHEAYDRLVAQTGSPTVDYLRYWGEVRGLFGGHGDTTTPTSEAIQELQRRWVDLLRIDPGARCVSRSVEELAPACRVAFDARGPGWPGARYHSPDVMIAARDADAIRTGACTFVLGEVHVALNTCGLPGFLNLLDDPAPLVRARDLDLPGPTIAPVIASDQATNKDHVRYSAHAFDLEIGDTPSWRPRDRVLAVGDLVVERRGDAVIVRDLADAHRFDVMEVFDTYLTAEVAPRFDMLPAWPHVPRVAIDELVIARERWIVERPPFAALDRGSAQFAEARRWARELGIPRWAFAKIPEERKPVFVDFDSPIYVELLAKLARHGSRIELTEMLPGVDECWLPGGGGETYACELRIVAVDAVAWQPV